MRGEDPAPAMCARLSVETPPRAWGRQQPEQCRPGKKGNTPTCVGKTADDVDHAQEFGNTPTCVGKTNARTAQGYHGKKHPHVRGEDRQAQAEKGNRSETPPRAWGRPVNAGGWLVGHGNTPTCVGKTIFFFSAASFFQKHPHVRGEDRFTLCQPKPTAETPPRAWGRRIQHGACVLGAGNTPTCVGKTWAPASACSGPRKHPHVRGEDAVTSPPAWSKSETPPRAWGRPGCLRRMIASLRNTPTCVGKTRTPRIGHTVVGKHPHVRGEDKATTSTQDSHTETPPRAWGRHIEHGNTIARTRNTPTCVGKTPRHPGQTHPGRKHPHVRGED